MGLSLISPSSGCHFSKITYSNGTWCCDDSQSDIGDNVTLPPIQDTTTEVTTTEVPINITTTTTTTAKPIIPVGDCVCGLGVELDIKNDDAEVRLANDDDDRARKLVRPWLAHVWIQKDSMEYQECSGSLLNKRWFISAAHCYCGTIHKCIIDEQGFAKVWPDPSSETKLSNIRERLKNVKVQFGTQATTDEGARKFYSIDKIVIHPDYFQGPDNAARPHDVALLRVDEDVLLQQITDAQTKITGLVPICLPPYVPVKPGDIIPALEQEEQKTDLGPGFMGARDFVLNATARIPFEDIDCYVVNGPVPYPYIAIPDVDQGYLACHPMGMINSLDLNIKGRTSFITAFGSTSRESGIGGDKSLRYMCRTNAYGPLDSIFHDCHGKCHKNIKSPYQIQFKNSENVDEIVQTRAANPSQHNKICEEFIAEVMDKGKFRTDFELDQQVGKVRHIHPIKVLLKGPDGEIECYPYKQHSVARMVQSGYDYPYKHGWCSVCERKGVQSTEDCEGLLSENSNWGWCLPECDEDWMQPDWHNYAHETLVDSFVYENCSHGVDTFTEFCTGSKFLTAYTMEYRYSLVGGKNRFQFIQGKVRSFHPGNTGWNNNNTIIRPGARYQGTQHTQVKGDVCYGDAGGSVWKMWSFRDLNKENKDNTKVERPPWGRLAVLTGVISRFEQHCGFFRPEHNEHWARPVQHSVHARVTMYMRWIMNTINDGGQCVPVTGSQRSGASHSHRHFPETHSWEYKHYEDDADEFSQ